MVVNLRWFEACSASRAFSDAEKAHGWPGAMQIEQLAAIQRPHAVGDLQGQEEQEALRDAIEAAVKDGSLYGIQLGSEGTGYRPMTAEEAARHDGLFGDGSGWFTPTQRRSIYGAAPWDFAKWLHAQGEQPSKHVLEWFKVCGVAWPPAAGASDVALPLSPPSGTESPAAAIALTDWDRLVSERNREMSDSTKQFRWSKDRAQVVQGEEARRKAEPGAKGVRQQMADEMSAGGNSITKQKLFQAMREQLSVSDEKVRARG